jgi:type VI secretion system protein ImpH
MADLTDVLAREGQSFGFFRAVSLLEEYFQKKEGDGSPVRTGRIRFSPDPSIAFPHSDITAATTENGVVRLMLSFMGLLGASSPLPNYFSDYIARNPENGEPLADFCALFNHRLYALFYEAFRKHHFALAAFSREMQHKLLCLAGVREHGENASLRMLAYAGILSTRRRSARGLETVVSDYFGGIPVSVTQWVARRARVPNPTHLGLDAALGINCTVGTEIGDISGKFRLTLGPLRRSSFESFLEGSANIEALRTVVASYVTDPLEFDIEVKLAASDLIPVVLGEDLARLGQTSALGRCAETAGEAYAVVLAGASQAGCVGGTDLEGFVP